MNALAGIIVMFAIAIAVGFFVAFHRHCPKCGAVVFVRGEHGCE